MSFEPAPDIGTRASLALTALTDPSAVPEPYGPELERQERRAASPDDDPYVAFACDMLNGIIGVTDPVDDERELERSADSLDILGGHIERIRESVTGDHGAIAGADAEPDRKEEIANDVTVNVTRALDLIDEAAGWLRGFAEETADAGYQCEDCAVNGMDCRIHGKAARLAARAIAQSPEGVVLALRQAGLIDEPETERG